MSRRVAPRLTVALFAGLIAVTLAAPTPSRTPLAPAGGSAAPNGSDPAALSGELTIAERGSFNGSISTLQRNRPPERVRREEEEGKPAIAERVPGRAPRTSVAPRSSAASPLLSIDGLNYQTHGDGVPPDPHGDVGIDHYIATVNTAIGIFAKSSGALINWFSFNDFMTSAGMTGACSIGNMGDPYVFFDRVSSRWFITDFAWLNDSGPFYECIAVSKTSSPVSGGWWTYSFVFGGNNLPDYPKFSAWSDGIYMTSNLFYLGSYYAGAEVVAFNRDDLISNAGTIRLRTKVLPDDYSVLPANDEFGTAAVGSPALFVSDANGLQLWRWAVDWNNAANSVWSGPFNITGNTAYSISPETIVQRGSAVQLDTLNDRLMSAAQWSNIGGNPALWISRSIDAGGGTAGIYWAEIRGLGGSSPTVYQDMKYSVASSNRWLPSLVVNAQGDMGVVFSYGDSSTYASLAYAGRTAGATLGTLDLGERSLATGLSAATTYSRWGDYFSASLDPVDDCSFWMFGEYMAAGGGRNWTTRISKVQLRACTSAPVNALAPSVPSTPIVGEAFTGVAGDWSNEPTLSYGWYRCSAAGVATNVVPSDCREIASAVGISYTPTSADAGKRLRIRVSAQNGAGSSFMLSAASNPVASLPINTRAATTSGTARVASTLTASSGSWSAIPSAAFAYRWARCTAAGTAAATLPGNCTLIDGATTQTYVATASDYGTYLRVRVTATNAAGSVVSVSKSTSAVAGNTPVNTIAPGVGGTSQVGQTLTATSGTWTAVPAATYSYAWFACTVSGPATAKPSKCSAIRNATSSTFVLTSAQVGKFIRVRVTATNPVGSSTYYSAATSAVAL